MRVSRGMGKIASAKAPQGGWIKRAYRRPSLLKKAAVAQTTPTPNPVMPDPFSSMRKGRR